MAFGVALPADAYVFSHAPDGTKPIDPDGISHRFLRLARRLGVNCRLHDLRHFTVTQLVAGGVDWRTVSGRADGHMTLATYQTLAAHSILEDAIASLSPDAAKQRACYLADRATVHVNEGEIDQACQLGMEALTILHDVEYATGVQRVRDLRARLKPYGGQLAVADLTDQLLLVP